MIQMVGEKTTIRFVYLLNMLPVIGMFVYYYTRYLAGTYSFFIPLGLTFAWLVLSLITGNIKGLLFNKVSSWWFVYLIMCAMMVIIGFSSTNLNFIISRLPIYLVPAIGYFVIRHYNRKEKAIIITAFILIYYSNLVYNIFLGYQFPNIFEEQESTEESIAFRVMMNIVSTEFIVVGYWLIGALLMVTLVVKEKLWRLLCVLFILPISYFMLFQSTRGTAVLLLIVEIVGLLLALFEPKNHTRRRGYYLFTVIALVLLVLIMFIPLMEWIISHLQSDRLAERLNDLIDFRQYGGNVDYVAEGSFTQRILLAQTSLNSFVSSPISFFIGIGDHTQSFGGDLIASGIGGHSEFIDVLARYGLVGAFVFWKIMKNHYEMLRQLTTRRETLKYVNVIYAVIVLSGVLNCIFFPSMQFFMFVVFPIIIELADNKISIKNGRKKLYRPEPSFI